MATMLLIMFLILFFLAGISRPHEDEYWQHLSSFAAGKKIYWIGSRECPMGVSAMKRESTGLWHGLFVSHNVMHVTGLGYKTADEVCRLFEIYENQD